MDTQNTFHRLILLLRKLRFLLLVSAAVLLQGTPAPAEIAVSTAADGQLFPLGVVDDEGGVVLMWIDYRTGRDWDVYTQRVDSTGTIKWQADGLPICTAIGNQRRLEMTRHDTHAIVVWDDRRARSNWDIYAQAVNFKGETLWKGDGIPICTNTTDQSLQAILSDGGGGVLIVWEDERRSTKFQDLYMQRINAEGTPMWERDGVPIFPSESLQTNAILVADSVGGFYVVWWDIIGYTEWHIMAYRLSLAGEPLWDAPRLVSPAVGMQGEPRAIADSKGGLIVVWQVYENFINDQLYAQRINPEGTPLWQENGTPLCTASGIQKDASIVSDGTGGLIAIWRDERDIYSDLYAQRIRANGTPAWEKDGIPFCVAGGHQDKPFIVPVEKERFFVAWLDYRDDFGEQSTNAIYGQQLDLSGALLLEKNGVAVSTSKGKHLPPFVVPIGNGQQAVLWSNDQRDSGDIFFKKF